MRTFRAMILVMAACVAITGANGQPKKRIAVSRFKDYAGYHNSGQGVADMLTTALVKSKKFMVVERQELEKVVQEQKLGASDMVTPETAPQIGKLLGVELLVVGSVSEFGTSERKVTGGMSILGAGVTHKEARAAVDIRLVNTTTGEIIASETESGSSSTVGVAVRYEAINFSDLSAWNNTDLGIATREAIDKCVELINENMANIPWSGRILKVNTDGTLLMKPGPDGNVTPGMEFDVFRMGEDIKDPDTGQSMGKEETKVGRIKSGESALNGKACKATVVAGSGFLVGDVVREAK